MRTNYVLIDSENVALEHLMLLAEGHFQVRIFLGAHLKHLPTTEIIAIQQMGARAEYIRISGNGRNALDFHIAYYIGRISAADPGAFFHIISKDTGFDPLIQHLKEQKILADRCAAITEIPLLKINRVALPSERAALVIERLTQLGSSKPRRLKTLSSAINTFFQKKLVEAEITALIQLLHKEGYVEISENKVSYPVRS